MGFTIEKFTTNGLLNEWFRWLWKGHCAIFQPASSSEPVVYESILEKAKLTGICKTDWFTKDADNVPLFLPPAAFSRMDGPQVLKLIEID